MILSNILHMRRRIFFWSAAIVSAFLALVLLPGHEQRVYDLEDDYVWNEYGPVIGIDLGDTYSRASIQIKGGETKVFRIDGAKSLIPLRAIVDEPDNMTIREGPEHRSDCVLLAMLKEKVEAHLGHSITHAVATVPFRKYYSDSQRHDLRAAGAAVKMVFLRILNAPSAAAMAYGLTKRGGETLAITYDLGGSTFDVSVLSVDDGVIEVLAAESNLHLGGDNIDKRITKHLAESYQRNKNIDITRMPLFLKRLSREAEKAKRRLSFHNSTLMEFELSPGGNILSEMLIQAKFEDLSEDIFIITIRLIDQILKDLDIAKDAIDEILLVGGSTHIPKVKQMLKDHFQNSELRQDVNPEDAIALGASIQGAILSGQQNGPYDGCTMSLTVSNLWIEVNGGFEKMFITRNTVIPTQEIHFFSTTEDNQSIFRVKLYEGERSLKKDRKYLGEVALGGILAAPRGIPKIEVTLQVDDDGYHIQIKDRGTGLTNSIFILGSHDPLSDEDIQNMVEESQRFATEDVAESIQRETLVSLSSFTEDLTNQLKDRNKLRGRISLAERKFILALIRETDAWVMAEGKSASVEELQSMLKELKITINEIVSKFYALGSAVPNTPNIKNMA